MSIFQHFQILLRSFTGVRSYDVLKNYSKITGEHRCWSLFLSKLQVSYFQSATFIKEETSVQVFSCGFCKMFKEHFYGAAPRDWFYKGNVVKVQFLIYCALFTKLRYLSNIFPKSINLGSLEGCYQVEHHIIPFPKWCCKKWQWVRDVARKFLEGGSRS